MSWIADKAFIAYRKAGLAVLEPLARRQAAAHGLPALMRDRPAGAMPPIWNDLWFLYANTRERRPKVVLEFGSGCSTIVIARALAENAAEGAPGRLYSLDADPHWGEATRQTMPAELAGHCELSVTRALKVDHAGTNAWRHESVPDVAPDLVYLDGPALAPDRRVAVDVLDMEERLPSGFRLIVDGRLQNCAFLEAHFRRRYRKRYMPVRKCTVFDLIG